MTAMPYTNLNQVSKRLNPKLFALWIGLGSIIMMFAAFTSAYLVKQGAGNWLQFRIPSYFIISSVVIVLSSIVLHYGYISYKNKNFKAYKLGLIITTILGFIFVVMQYKGWAEMFANGVDMKSNVGGSFFYLITGAHATHVLAGISVLIVTTLNAYAYPIKYYEEKRNRNEMVLHFWHFLGFLWIYLFVFLNIIR